VNRSDHRRRISTVAGCVGDDLARKWEEKTRAFDEQQWQRTLLRNALHTKYPAINQFNIKQNVFAIHGFGFKCEHDIKIRLGKRICVHIHINIDRGSLLAWTQRQWRTRTLEGKIFYILCKNIEAWLRTCAIFIPYFSSCGHITRRLGHRWVPYVDCQLRQA